MNPLRAAAATSAIAAAVAFSSGAQPTRFADPHRMLPWDGTGLTQAVALGDVDGDGDRDAVFGIEGDPLLDPSSRDRLYLNDGTGLLQVAPSNLPPILDETYAVALGDVDGDGDLDLLFGNYGPERLSINGGSGVFADAPGQIPSVPDATVALAFGDFDGDGDLDALVGNTPQDRLYLNDGTGAFSDATSLLPSLSGYTRALASGDLDGDGDLDALFADFGSGRLYLNDGTGGFSNVSGQLPPPVVYLETAIALGDADADGDLDAVVGGIGVSTPWSQAPAPVVVYQNDGAAVFSAIPQGFVTRTSFLSLGDLNGDSDLDLLLGASGACGKFGCSLGQSFVLANDGLGVFTAVGGLQPPTWPTSGALGDLDGDGDLDAVVGTGYFAGLSNHVYLNNGAGLLKEASGQVAPAPSGASTIALGDLDADGDLDAFFAGVGALYTQVGGPSRVLLNDGTGTLQDAPAQPAGSSFASDVALGDADGDGDLDALLVSTYSYISGVSHRLYLNNGAGAFVVARGAFPQDLIQASTVALRDVEGDGDLDAVVGVLAGGFPSPPTPIRLYQNAGPGTFSFAPAAFPQGPGGAADFAVGDLDGDGDLDVFAGALNGPSRLYLNSNGTGVFSNASSQLPSFVQSTAGVALGDVDGDGDLDAFIANGPSAAQDRLYLNDGVGVFLDATAQLPAESDAGGPVALLDADGDGDLDAWIGTPPLPKLYLNGGSAVFFDASSGLPVGWSAAADLDVGDLDGDGDLDAVLADSGEVRVLSNFTRQLAWRALPRIGKPLTFDLHGPAWGAWFLVASLGTGSTPIPPLGVVRLDLATLIPILGGLLDAEGHAAVTYQVPAVPSLVGQTLSWQAVVVGPARLTNLEKTTFTNL